MIATPLAVHDVAKSYRRRTVLRGVSFEVHPGEILGAYGLAYGAVLLVAALALYTMRMRVAR